MRSRRPVVPALATSVLCLAWLLASGSTLWDRDEPRFARAAVEMRESGDWLVPTFNGRLRPDKPAAIYWLMASSTALLGDTEWAVRLWAGLGLAATMLVTARFVRRHLPQGEPWVAATVVGLAPLAFVVGTAATTDGVLLALVTGEMVVLADGLLDRWTPLRIGLLGLLLGAGLLVKGPVALAVPGLTMVWFAAATAHAGDQRWRRDLSAFATAAVLGAAAFLAWALPANAATAGELARRGLGHHVIGRMAQPLESHGGDFFAHLPYYPLVLVIGLLPFSGLLPGAMATVWLEGRGTAAVRRFLLAWVAPTVVLMTLVATKLPHYVLPVAPALAAIIAAGLDGGRLSRRWWTAGVVLLAGAGVVLAAALVAGGIWTPVAGLRIHLLGLAFTVAAGTVVGARALVRRRRRTAVLGLALATVIGLVQLRLLMPVVEELKPAPPVARAVRAVVGPEVPVAAAGFREPSLAFYLGRSFVELDLAEVGEWLSEPSDGVLIADVDVLADLPLGHTTEIARRHGFNVAKGRWVEVVALRRVADHAPGDRPPR